MLAISRVRWKARFRRDGIEGVAMVLRTTTDNHAEVIRAFGGRVGRNCSIHPPLHIVNAAGDFSNLEIGDNVRLGPDVLIDLADRVTVEDQATLSTRCTLLTQVEGRGRPRDEATGERAPVRIGAGAYLGEGATVRQGITVGPRALLEAHALVNGDIPADAVVVSPLARELQPRAPRGAEPGPR
jgi:acetyltransferase-like isoleucine patch superfamily enzyme